MFAGRVFKRLGSNLTFTCSSYESPPKSAAGTTYNLKKTGANGTHSQFLVFGQSDELQNAVRFVKIVLYSTAQKPGMVTQYTLYRIPSICTSRTCGMSVVGRLANAKGVRYRPPTSRRRNIRSRDLRVGLRSAHLSRDRTKTARSQRRIAQWKLSGQGTERYYFSGIARATKKMPQSHLVWYSDAN